MANGADANAADKHGQTAFHKTVARFDEQAAELLLKHKADINAKDDTGATPLHHAATEAKIPVVRWLLASGADINLKDDEGNTPLARARKGQKVVPIDREAFYARMPGHLEIEEILQGHGAKE